MLQYAIFHFLNWMRTLESTADQSSQGTENFIPLLVVQYEAKILVTFAALIHCILGFRKSNYWIANSLAWIIHSTIQQITISDLPTHI